MLWPVLLRLSLVNQKSLVSCPTCRGISLRKSGRLILDRISARAWQIKVLRWLDRLQSCLLVLVMLPVVTKNGECVRDAVGRVLHLELYWVLAVIHLFVVLGLLNRHISLLSIRLLGVNR